MTEKPEGQRDLEKFCMFELISSFVLEKRNMPKIDNDTFREAVYDIVRTIPYGRATSYGAIAKAIGYYNMPRMVGQVMSRCSTYEVNIPAHRVVNSQGILSGKDAFGNLGEMQKLLEAEGIIIINDRIKNWKTVFWNPLEEINI